jgi:molybdate transport system regulatory protein
MAKSRTNTVDGRLWIDRGDTAFLGHGRVELLAQIDQTGSISAAARAMGMSYKAAWDAVDAMNNLAERPLVERSAGGRRGGGTRLTEEGRQTVAMFREVEAEYRQFLTRLDEGLSDFAHFHQLMRRFALKTSARNQFLGHITRVTPGAVNGEVVIDLGHGDELVAIITNESIDCLALAPGREAYALIKSSAPILAAGDTPPRTSARNRLCGTVLRCTEGAVNGEVTLELAGGRLLTAIITNESLRSLELAPGVAACALIKAADIIIAVND